jgi:glycosyltransferase involved in cell wall biosynthesis
MFKVADYLIQAQAFQTPAHAAQLRPLDTRGGGHAALSALVLLSALFKLLRGRLQGQLAGVHVNMAERLSLFRKSALIAWCRLLGIPVVLHLHAAQLHPFYAGLPRPLQRMTRWIFSLPASVVVLGQASRRFVIDTLGVPPERIEIVINGVPEPQEPRRRAAAGAVQRVLFVGNLSERKGVSDLLRAVAQPGFDTGRLRVTFAGGGDVADYEAKARALGVDRFVRFVGWADQRKVAQLMASHEVLVLPSYDEGLPLVILEALAHGMAVVCTPVGEIPTELEDGVNARFVPPGDVPAIAAGLQEVLERPELLALLGRNGRAHYESRFSMTQFFAAVARVHQKHFGVSGHPRSAGAAPQDARP